MKAAARARALTALSLVALVLVACSGPGTTGADSASEGGSPFVLEESSAVEKEIVAADGGSIEVTSSAGDIVHITFPRGSLAGDAVLSAAPLAESPLNDDNVVVPGFTLSDTVTGEGPALSAPALISVVVDGELPATTSLVRYTDDGLGYEVVPTTVASRDGKTQLTAAVMGFSAYGGMSLTQDELNAAQPDPTLADFDWVIYINDITDVPGAPIAQTIELNLTARNTSGNILGPYTGTATAVTTNEGDYMGVHISATAQSQSTHLDFTMGPTLAPLVAEDPDADLPLAPLTDGTGPDFTGYGSIAMSSSGSGTASAGGLTASGGFGNDSSQSIEVYLNGPLARLAVHMPQGVLYFDGYIIGEGK